MKRGHARIFVCQLFFIMRKILLSIVLLLCACFSSDAKDTSNMVFIEKGTFWMGSDEGLASERPAHQVTLDSYWIDKYPVTNKQYLNFVQHTGYVTYSERDPDPKDFPGVPKDKLVAGSAVFKSPEQKVDMRNYLNWWFYVPGANWKHPEGFESDLTGRENHPVVHMTYTDVEAYCKWAGKELPTEAQFEYAARGGFEKKKYTWGDQPKHYTEPLANIWQGEFPYKNENIDNFMSTSPVGSFPPNGYDLYDMAGNVWEWTQDWFHPYYYKNSPKKNPGGVTKEESLDPNEPGIPKRVVKGGSFLCSENYCTGYRPSARMATDPLSSFGHTGFRCVKN